MMFDEFDTASCTRCSRTNDAHFRDAVSALQARDFAEIRSDELEEQAPVRAEELAAWLADVDAETLAMIGMAHDQLPSWYWADAHEVGLTPHEAAHFAVEDTHQESVADGWYLARYATAVAEDGENHG